MIDWEPYIGEPEAPPAPVRTIALTPELIAEDERRRREREAGNSSDWKIKASLSVDNLRKVRAQQPSGRHHDFHASAPRVIRPKAPKPRKPTSTAPVATPAPHHITFQGEAMAAAAQFTIEKPVHEADVPQTASSRGRPNAYSPVMDALRKMAGMEFLPLTFPNAKLRTNALYAVRNLAKQEGKGLEKRLVGLTAYIRLTTLEPKQK